MREVLRSNDPVLISFALHLLSEEGIDAHVFDNHISAVEGSIMAFPQRIVVAGENFDNACRVLGNASLTITG